MRLLVVSCIILAGGLIGCIWFIPCEEVRSYWSQESFTKKVEFKTLFRTTANNYELAYMAKLGDVPLGGNDHWILESEERSYLFGIRPKSRIDYGSYFDAYVFATSGSWVPRAKMRMVIQLIRNTTQSDLQRVIINIQNGQFNDA